MEKILKIMSALGVGGGYRNVQLLSVVVDRKAKENNNKKEEERACRVF